MVEGLAQELARGLLWDMEPGGCSGGRGAGGWGGGGAGAFGAGESGTCGGRGASLGMRGPRGGTLCYEASWEHQGRQASGQECASMPVCVCAMTVCDWGQLSV